MKNVVADIEETSEQEILAIFSDASKLVGVCNQVRERVKVHPSQSNFRVAAVFIIEHTVTDDANDAKTQTSFVCGSNAEQGFIGGAICAERATLCRLRFYENAKILKVIVTTDSEHAIAPGGLCREFLMSAAVPETPVVAGNATGSKIVECLLGELWPFPYVYRYCVRCNLVDRAQEFSWKVLNTPDSLTIADISVSVSSDIAPSTETANSATSSANTTASSNPSSEKIENIQLQDERYAYLVSVMNAAKAVNHRDNFDDIHPIRLSAAVLFSDGHIETAWQWKALEYGCTVDPICQLLNVLKQYPEKMKETQAEEVVPRTIVMVDQFHICHAPFAAGRSVLIEHGFGAVEMFVHTTEGKLMRTTVKDLFPTSESFGANLSHDDFHN